MRDAGLIAEAHRALDATLAAADVDAMTVAAAHLHRARLYADVFEPTLASDTMRRFETATRGIELSADTRWLARSVALRVAAFGQDPALALEARRALHDGGIGAAADAADSALYAASHAFRIGDLEDARRWVARAERLESEAVRRPLFEANVVHARAEIEGASDAGGAVALLRSAIRRIVAADGPQGLGYARLALRFGYESVPTQPVEARAALMSALSWFQRELGDANRLTMNARELLAYASGQLGRYDEAIAHQRIVVAAYSDRDGKHARSTLTARHALANALSRAGRHAEQRDVLSTALTDASAVLSADAREVLYMNVELASAQWALGRRDEACGLADRVARVQGDRLDDALRVEVDYVLASCLRWRGRRAEAVEAFRRNIDARRRVYGGYVVGEMIDRAALARTLIDGGEYGAAIAELQALEAFAESSRARELPAAGSGRTSFAWWGRSREDEAGYRDLALLYARTGREADAIRTAESGRSRSVNDALDLRVAAAGLPARARVAAAKDTARLREIEASLAFERAGSARHLSLELERARVLESIRRLSAGEATQTAVPTWQQAAERLPRDTAFVGFQIVHQGLWAYVVRRNGLRVVVLDAAVPMIDALTALRELLQEPRAPLRIYRLADGAYASGLVPPHPTAVEVPRSVVVSELRRALVDPLRRAGGDARRWIVAPDGPLATVPLEALLDRADPISRNGVQYASSLLSWAAAERLVHRRGRGALDVVAIGGVAYPRDRVAGPGPIGPRVWPALAHASGEVEEVMRPFPRSRTLALTASAATKGGVEQLSRDGRLGSARFVHIAAHALLVPAFPQWSSIVLAGRTPDEPGYLTAAELATLDLDADLVTLSACETAAGEAVEGEGVFGLPYALTVAGARAALLTLWPVDDESTAAFMKRFYARLAKGERPANALAATKREFQAHPRWSAPFHWAPFVLYGAG